MLGLLLASAGSAQAPMVGWCENQYRCADLWFGADPKPTYDEDRVGGVLTVTVRVENRGLAASSATSLIIRAAPGSTLERVGEADVPKLAPGTSEVIEVDFEDLSELPRDRAVSFLARVDPDDQVKESHPGNNRYRFAVRLRPRIDLRGTANADLRPNGRRVVLTAEVENVGEDASVASTVKASAPSSWNLKPVYANLEALQPGQRTRPLEFRFPIPEAARGTEHTFRIVVDPENFNDEPDEWLENGMVEVDLEVPELYPDLHVEKPVSRFLDDGGVLRIQATVRNRGAARSLPVEALATAEGWKEQAVALRALEPGATGTLVFEFPVPDDQRGTSPTFAVRVPWKPTGESGTTNANNRRTLVVQVPEEAVAVPPDRPVPDPDQPPDTGSWVEEALVVLGVLFVAGVVTIVVLWKRRHRRRGVPGPPPFVPNGGIRTGFSRLTSGGAPLPSGEELACDEWYYFWLDVASAPTGSLAPSDPRLTVGLFSLDGGMHLDPHADTGEIRLSDERARVERQPVPWDELTIEPDVAAHRLFFPLRTPASPGVAQLRCSIYVETTLVQSLLVRAPVAREPGRHAESAFGTEVDYSLVPSLDRARLASLPTHRLTIMVNENPGGSHGFSFFGSQEFKSEVSIDALALQDSIDRARRALHAVAWGDPDPWDETKSYLYERTDRARLERDLILLAKRGLSLYSSLGHRLAGGAEEERELEAIMTSPGAVQVAMREPALLVPVALFYDYKGLDPDLPADEYTLCPDFAAALDLGAPLEELRCFRGECRSRGAETTVCPSGFWGYRHSLGFPLSATGGPDTPVEIRYEDDLEIVVLVSTDPTLMLRDGHERTLRSLRPGLGWNHAATREDALRLLRESKAQVVYFYGHGGFDLDAGSPYLLVGPPGERGISPAALHSLGVEWRSTRPLVFLNGCNTTALEPSRAVNFVTPLVRLSGAAGVLGAETTIFEPLGSAFAEECLRRFLAGVPIGEAVRGSRLALLKEGNPLGLVYVPFALAGLRVVGGVRETRALRGAGVVARAEG